MKIASFEQGGGRASICVDRGPTENRRWRLWRVDRPALPGFLAASRLLVGPYEADVANAEQQLAWDGGPPESFGMELFPGELERLEANLLGAMARVPAFGEVGISSVTNGPTIWAADALPRVGATPVRGYFDFNTLTYGSIAHALLAMTY